MFKKALIALAFVIGAQCASAALPAFNQKFEKNGQPIAEKPLVARDFIEFRTARGFPLDGYKDLAGNPQSLSQFKDKLVIVDVWGFWSATCQRSAPLMAEFQAKYNKPESRIRFVSISLDKNPKRVTKFAKKTKLPETFTSWHDPDLVIPATLPADVLPGFFVLDGHGHLVGFVRGFVDWADPAVPAYFEKLADKYAVRK